MTSVAADDRIISVDDHVIEPPNLWVDRVAPSERHRVPHVVEEDGISVWVYEDVEVRIPGLFVQAGRPEAEIKPELMSYESMRPAYFVAEERAKDMDKDGVLASMCFPTIPRYCGQLFLEAKDREMALTCLRAYNDWTVEDWAGGAPGRFIPLLLVPLWDPKLAAEELRRGVANGGKAVSFSENPAKLGLPSLHDRDGYWDPFLEAVNETGVPICIHFGSSSMVPNTADDAPIYVSAVLSPLNLFYAAADWVFSKRLERFENLKICLSEGGIGWMPYFLERADYVLESMPWAAKYDPYDYDHELKEGLGPALRPSELFRRHIYGCFIDDEVGLRNVDLIGTDKIMIETDYPHGDGTYPHSLENALRLLENFDEPTRYQIMQGNARRVFDLTEVPA